jgi:hypothetical protein
VPARRDWLPRLALQSIAIVIVVLAVACNGDEQTPSRLIDGSPTRALPVELEGLMASPVLTDVRIARVGQLELDSTSASCLQRDWDAEPAGQMVERTGVSSETVTFRNGSGDGLYGCDNSVGPREEDRRWCGGAFGRLYSGHLRDPRLDMGGCITENRELVGFVWIEPSRDSRYVAVEQPGFAEVYRVAGGLPIRVATTSGIEIGGSRATFDLSEHDARGRLLRKYRLEAAVAG